MNEQYTASVYTGSEQFAKQVGNDLDELYTWMLIQGNVHFGDVHGEIIDNKTKKTLRTFRKCAIE